jgi:hypothetical protein
VRRIESRNRRRQAIDADRASKGLPPEDGGDGATRARGSPLVAKPYGSFLPRSLLIVPDRLAGSRISSSVAEITFRLAFCAWRVRLASFETRAFLLFVTSEEADSVTASIVADGFDASPPPSRRPSGNARRRSRGTVRFVSPP